MSKVAGANLPRTVDGALAQASLIRLAVGLPIESSWHCRCVAYGVSQCYHGIVLKHHPFVKVL